MKGIKLNRGTRRIILPSCSEVDTELILKAQKRIVRNVQQTAIESSFEMGSWKKDDYGSFQEYASPTWKF